MYVYVRLLIVWLSGFMPISRVARVGIGLVAVTVAEFSAVLICDCVPSIVTVALFNAPAAIAVLPCVRFTVPFVTDNVARTVSPFVNAVDGLL